MPKKRAAKPKKSVTTNWKRYQDQAAEFFRSLECDVGTDLTVKGARDEHDIDVWVRFRKFGLETKWVIDCKYWKRRITKKDVLALRTIVKEVGADRGILISTVGFQSGAIHSAEKTNITLTSLDELKETAWDDLISSALHGLETKLVRVNYALHELFTRERTSEHSLLIKPRAGVDHAAVMNALGNLSMLKSGFDEIRAGKSPYSVGFDESGQAIVAVETLEAFVAYASRVIGEAEMTLRANAPLNP